MSLWIARDKNGLLWLYDRKPERRGRLFACDSYGGKCYEISRVFCKTIFPEVTWENSPKELTIKEE